MISKLSRTHLRLLYRHLWVRGEGWGGGGGEVGKEVWRDLAARPRGYSKSRINYKNVFISCYTVSGGQHLLVGGHFICWIELSTLWLSRTRSRMEACGRQCWIKRKFTYLLSNLFIKHEEAYLLLFSNTVKWIEKISNSQPFLNNLRVFGNRNKYSFECLIQLNQRKEFSQKCPKRKYPN